jgi:hypothetical protein
MTSSIGLRRRKEKTKEKPVKESRRKSLISPSEQAAAERAAREDYIQDQIRRRTLLGTNSSMGTS